MAKSNIKVTRKKLSDYTPDPHNANLGSERGYRAIDNSITEDGAGRSGLVDKNGVVIAGNQTLEVLAANGIEDVIEVETTGQEWVIVKRTDTDLSDDNPNNMARRMAYRDNRSVELSLTWSPEQLQADKEAGVEIVDKLWHPVELEEMLNRSQSDDTYSRKIEAPTYEPSGEKPQINELFDDAKTKRLVLDIEAYEGISEDEKEFLIIAAQRHTVLDFGKIADYYSHADEGLQSIMEDSALVIIDFDKAIELGFVQLTERIAEIVGEEYGE